MIVIRNIFRSIVSFFDKIGLKGIVVVYLLFFSLNLFAPPPPDPQPPPEAEVPIDGGVIFLLLGGFVMFTRNIIKNNKKDF